MNRSALVRATVIGVILQLAMIVTGHFVPAVKDHVFMFGGMGISLLAGLIYTLSAKGGWGHSLLGGVIAGGVCALIGILASFALGDVPAPVIIFGTCSSALTGLIGAAIGKLINR